MTNAVEEILGGSIMVAEELTRLRAEIERLTAEYKLLIGENKLLIEEKLALIEYTHKLTADLKRAYSDGEAYWRNEYYTVTERLIADRHRLKAALEQIARMDKIDGPFWRTARRALAEGTGE